LLDAFTLGLEILSRGDGPLARALNYFLQLKAVFESGGILATIGFILPDMSEILAWLHQIDTQMAEAIGQVDWREVGDAFGDALMDSLGQNINGNAQSSTARAIAQAISEFLLGAMGYVDWNSVGIAIDRAFFEASDNLDQWFFDLANRSDQWFMDLGWSIVNGLINGMNQFELDAAAWMREHVVDPIKRFLGIASPSTLFMQIGKDIVQGLINGITSMFSSLSTAVGNMFDILTGGSGGGTGGATGTFGGFGDTGTIGGRIMDRTTTGGVLAGGTVTNIYNFYAPVYMSGVGPEGTYDCAPSPMISSGANPFPSGYR
jgi:hypothetical protein